MAQHRPKFTAILGFTLIEVFVVIAILSLLLAFLLEAVAGAREVARRVRCANQLKQIALATQGYEGTYGVYPTLIARPLLPQAQRQYSIFVSILPFLEEGSLYNEINLLVDLQDYTLVPFRRPNGGSEANETAISRTVATLLCPSDSVDSFHTASEGANYRGSTGMIARLDQHERGGIFGVTNYLTTGSITDGLSNTAAFSEKLRGNPQRNWLNLRTDFLIDPYNEFESSTEDLVKCAQQPLKQAQYYSAVGVNWLVGTLTQTLYNHLETPNSTVPDCMQKGFNPVVARATARSNHFGGVNIALADGSVRFIKQTINAKSWQALATKASGDLCDEY